MKVTPKIYPALASLILALGLCLSTAMAASISLSQPGKVPAPMSLNVPLYFEANQGQSDDGIKYLARGHQQDFFVTPTEIVLSLHKTPDFLNLPMHERMKAARTASLPTRSVRWQFIGANPQAAVQGLGQLDGKVNYFIGNDPHQWHTRVPTCSQVEVDELYPGISVRYYGNQEQLEYDFNVAAGADPSVIALRIDGADKLSLDKGGGLVMKLGDREVLQPKPAIYQMIKGARKDITGGYEIKNGSTVQFIIGAYDHSQPLVIDPILSYATYFGGVGTDIGWAVQVGQDGSVYVAGQTTSPRFLADTPGFQINYVGGSSTGDAFVAKFSKNGSNLIYFTYLGGGNDDVAFALAVDGNNSAYVTGFTSSPNFPTNSTPPNSGAISYRAINGAPNPVTHVYIPDAFVTKLSPDGTQLTFSMYLGGTGEDVGYGIALDSQNQVYVTGYTVSPNFPVTASSPQSAFAGGIDAFVTKIAGNGQSILFSTFLGGSSDDEGQAIAVDSAQNAYITGYTFSPESQSSAGAIFSGTGSAAPGTLNGMGNVAGAGASSDAFVAKYSTTNAPTPPASLVFYALLGGSNSDAGVSIALDASSDIFVTGFTESFDFPNSNSVPNLGNGNIAVNGAIEDVFLDEIKSDGSTLMFSTVFGGTAGDVGFGLALDPSGDVFITGYTVSVDFPTFNTTANLRSASTGGYEPFVTAINIVNGNPPVSTLLYSAYLGGSADDFGLGIAADPLGNAYVVGWTASTDFPVTNSPPSSLKGAPDMFLEKISLFPQPALTITEPEDANFTENIVLKWPAPPAMFSSRFGLQQNTSLVLPSTWVPVGQTPILSNGTNIVTLPIGSSPQFFRLGH